MEKQKTWMNEKLMLSSAFYLLLYPKLPKTNKHKTHISLIYPQPAALAPRYLERKKENEKKVREKMIMT